jgi:hypothetical protein
MKIVGKNDAMTRLRTTDSLFHPAVENILSFLNVIWVGPVLSIKVVVCYNIAKILHDGLAGIVAFGIRRTHVCWVFSKDIADSHFSLHHFVVSLVICDVVQVRMAPSVTSDLMTLSIHSPDDVDPPGVRINSTMAIVSANEEGSLEAILCQVVEDLASVNVGTIVECDSDGARFLASDDTSTTVGYIPLLRAWIIARGRSGLTRL